ncbi:MAG TPA: CoA transferase [Thermoleophilaceae bacterium]|jgi:crotonobetainyl-CoA:carnitine CoA-transferase CaiB-like acyl-CoA transferase
MLADSHGRSGEGLLDGLRVVEFSRLIAAPFCGLTLSDLGADVVKVESPGGDDARSFPPLLANGSSAYFHALNRGKRGAVLDLSDAAARETARRLVARADVVVENLGESTARLGFGYEDVSEPNPRLVWCSITGLGAREGGRAVDPSLQASMGLMALTGEPDRPPLRVPVPLIDLMTGMYAAQSVLTALWRAERTGRGAFLDCALVDSAATLTSLTALLALCGADKPRRLGSESHLVVPSAVYATADDRFVQVVAVNERHWEALCAALDRPEWLDDDRCADNAARVANRRLVNERIGEAIATGTARDWVERITRAGGLCERVREIEEAWADPLLAARGLVGRPADWAYGDLSLPLVSLARGADPHALALGPALGEHTEAVLRELR